MVISMVEANSVVSVLNTQDSVKSEPVKTSGIGEISDIYSESDETQKFKEIASKYDITNMSRNEANEMFKELYDNDLISFKDMMKATFDPTRIPGWQDGVSSVNGWKVSSNPDVKINYLEGFRIQAEYNEKYGDSKFQENYDKMVELAEKIKYFQA